MKRKMEKNSVPQKVFGDRTLHKHGASTLATSKRSATLPEKPLLQRSTSHQHHHGPRVRPTVVNGAIPNDAHRTQNNLNTTRTKDNSSNTRALFFLFTTCATNPHRCQTIHPQDHPQGPHSAVPSAWQYFKKADDFHSPAMRISPMECPLAARDVARQALKLFSVT